MRVDPKISAEIDQAIAALKTLSTLPQHVLEEDFPAVQISYDDDGIYIHTNFAAKRPLVRWRRFLQHVFNEYKESIAQERQKD